MLRLGIKLTTFEHTYAAPNRFALKETSTLKPVTASTQKIAQLIANGPVYRS
jgi:hypothetical protein